MSLAFDLTEAGVAPGLAERLAAFGDRLLTANQRVNLTGARTRTDMVAHLVDSLTLLPYVRGPLVDVGSGGGLPAIPLALALGIEIALVESVGKKCAFLREVLREFNLSGIVVEKRAEEAGRDSAFRDRFLCGTARAVATAPSVLELIAPLLAPGGRAVLQRGTFDAPEREAVKDAAPMLGAAFEEVVEIAGGRRILLVNKVTLTPERFPRRAGIPQKRPLCFRVNVPRETI